MNTICYDFYYTVNKIRDENKKIDNQFENDDNDFIDKNDLITPNHYVGNEKKIMKN